MPLHNWNIIKKVQHNLLRIRQNKTVFIEIKR